MERNKVEFRYNVVQYNTMITSYRQISNKNGTLGNNLADHSDVVGAAPTGAYITYITCVDK